MKTSIVYPQFSLLILVTSKTNRLLRLSSVVEPSMLGWKIGRANDDDFEMAYLI